MAVWQSTPEPPEKREPLGPQGDPNDPNGGHPLEQPNPSDTQPVVWSESEQRDLDFARWLHRHGRIGEWPDVQKARRVLSAVHGI